MGMHEENLRKVLALQPEGARVHFKNGGWADKDFVRKDEKGRKLEKPVGIWTVWLPRHGLAVMDTIDKVAYAAMHGSYPA